MSTLKWVDNHIEITPPKRPKKITGTRFAAIRGLNKWSTPFETWCAITRTYEEPFEDTIYTIAGKMIEPKQAEYMKRAYAMYNLVTPTDVYGKDYFKKTKGDFFPDSPVFGGMWDYLLVDDKNRPTTVLEMKTTRRAEDWGYGPPEYYAEQAALYAALLGVDNVIMVCTILKDADYKKPEKFVVSSKNTFLVPFKVSERYPEFSRMMQDVLVWWSDHVTSGISPDYDEKKDADILKALRTNTVSDQDDLSDLMNEAEELKQKIDAHHAVIEDAEARYKLVTEAIKDRLQAQFRDGDKTVNATGKSMLFAVSKSERLAVDEDALKADGLLEKYKTRKSQVFKLSVKKIE